MGMFSKLCFYFILLLFLVYFFFERERGGMRERAGDGQRERESQNLKQTPGSELSAQILTWGSNSRPEPKSDA